jgi:hypothetical protein
MRTSSPDDPGALRRVAARVVNHGHGPWERGAASSKAEWVPGSTTTSADWNKDDRSSHTDSVHRHFNPYPNARSRVVKAKCTWMFGARPAGTPGPVTDERFRPREDWSRI